MYFWHVCLQDISRYHPMKHLLNIVIAYLLIVTIIQYVVTHTHTHTHTHIHTHTHSRLGGLVVIHSAAGVNGPGFNSPVTRAYLRFNSQASTLAGKQCLTMRCTVATNCDRVMQCSWHLWFADLTFDNKRTIWGAAKNPRRGLSTRIVNLPTAPRY